MDNKKGEGLSPRLVEQYEKIFYEKIF